MESIFIEQLQTQGFSVLLLVVVAYVFYKENSKLKDFFYSENQKLKGQIDDVNDKYETLLTTIYKEQIEIINQNTSVLNEVKSILKNDK